MRIRGARRVVTAMVAVVVAVGGLLALDVVPAGADASITSSGPLTQVGVGTTLNCSANHVGDTSGEFFNGTSCGTWTIVDDALYGPFLSVNAYTPVSQTGPTGTGTAADPYKIVTVVDLGTTGVRLTQTDTYTTGLESFRTDVALANTSASSHTVRVYRAADCYLQNSDSGYGAYDAGTGAVACTTGLDTGSRIEQWFPITPGSHAFESFYSTVYSRISSKLPFDDTCGCTTLQDNGAGLSWDATVAGSSSKTFSSLITFSPLGILPLSMSITPDNASVTSGGTAGYTIAVHNPNAAAVTLSSVSDAIPATFGYVAGSTTGLTTANPSVGGGNTLTWAGPLVVPGGGDGTLHFSATVGTTAGTFTSSATAANADGYTIAPTGPDGAVTVGGTPPITHHLTVAVSGSGSVSSTPGGIACPTACGADFSTGTDVALSATPASGSTFSGWSGACTGTGPCSVAMSTERSVTATFSSAPGDVTVTGTAAPTQVTAGGVAKTHFTIRNNSDGRVGVVLAGFTLPAGTTPVSITPSNGLCGAFSGGSAACLFGDISAGGTRGIDVLFQIPAGATGPFPVAVGLMTDGGGTASTSAGPTAVAPTPGTAAGFVPPGGSISTGTSPTATDNTVATFTLPGSGGGAPITLRAETAGVNTFCAGPCSGKILFLSPFSGYNDPRHPAILKIVWDKTVAGRGVNSDLYVQKAVDGPIVKVANCRDTRIHLADPHPCVHERTKRGSGDIEFEILLISGDPRFGRR
jgi:uncharacterized repeat protein (TIGR01451 family)